MAYRKYSHDSAELVKCAGLDEPEKWTELICSSRRKEPGKYCALVKDSGFDISENLGHFYEILSEAGKAEDGSIPVLVIAGGMPKSGAAEMLVNLARYAPGGFSFHYLLRSGRRNDYVEELSRLGASVHLIPERQADRRRFYRGMGEIIKKYGIRAAVTTEKNLSGLVLAYAMNKGVKIRVSYPHDTGAEGDGTLPGKIKIAAMRLTTRIFANRICACCRAAGEWKIGKKAFERRGMVVRNGTECERYRYSEDMRGKTRSRIGIPDGSFVIGNVAYLSRLKNQEFLIDLMPEILRRKPEAFLLLCGDDWENLEDRLRRKAEDLKIADRVVFAGKTDHTEEYYSAMDVFALPSLREAAPLALIEAQANGLPCVVSCYVPDETDLKRARPGVNS